MAEKGESKILAIITICILLISIGLSGCVESGHAQIPDITISINEEHNYLNLSNFFDNITFSEKYNISMSILLHVNNKKIRYNSTKDQLKITFKNKEIISINSPKKGNEFQVIIEFILFQNDNNISELKLFNDTNNLIGKIKVIDYGKIKFFPERNNLFDINEFLIIERTNERTTIIKIYDLWIKIHASVVLP